MGNIEGSIEEKVAQFIVDLGVENLWDNPLDPRKVALAFERIKKVESIEERVVQLIIDQLGVEKEQVILKASFLEDLGADSLDTVELVMAFEEGFDIEISEDDAEKIITVKDAVDYITAHI